MKAVRGGEELKLDERKEEKLGERRQIKLDF